jgi:hypothetical protein
MYTFLSSLLQGTHSKADGIRIPGNTMSDQCYGRIKNMFHTPTINLYDYALYAVATKGIRLPSHVFYPNNIDNLGITRHIPEYSMPRRSLAHLDNIRNKLLNSRPIDRAELAAIRGERETIIANAKAKLAAKIAANLAAAGLPPYAARPEPYRRVGAAGLPAYAAAGLPPIAARPEPYRRAGAGGLPLIGRINSVPEGKKANADPSCCSWIAGVWRCLCGSSGGSRKTKNCKRKNRRQRATRRRQ